VREVLRAEEGDGGDKQEVELQDCIGVKVAFAVVELWEGVLVGLWWLYGRIGGEVWDSLS
jgi:hypothetical protein